MSKAGEAIVAGGGEIYAWIHDGFVMRFGSGLIQGNQLCPPEQDPRTASLCWAGHPVGKRLIAIDVDTLQDTVLYDTGFLLRFKQTKMQADMSFDALLEKVLEPAFAGALIAEEDEEHQEEPLCSQLLVIEETSKNKDMVRLRHFLSAYADKLRWSTDGKGPG